MTHPSTKCKRELLHMHGSKNSYCLLWKALRPVHCAALMCFAAAFLLMHSSVVFANAVAQAPSDVRGVRWGDTLHEVRAVECKPLLYLKESCYIIKEEIFGQACSVVFTFKKDKLEEIKYIFKNSDIQTLLKIREKISQKLEEKFSKGISEIEKVSHIRAYNNERTHALIAMDALPKHGGYILLVTYCSQEKYKQILEQLDADSPSGAQKEQDDLSKF